VDCAGQRGSDVIAVGYRREAGLVEASYGRMKMQLIETARL
jgi:hypothetical protein